MTIRATGGIRTGEDTEDLRAFLAALTGGPEVHETVVLGCERHGDERPAWAYVEADPRAGVARRRCLQCATGTGLLDSESRWTHPQMWSCGSCAQSIAEVAVGLSVPDGEHVVWVVVGVRCVDCGRLQGLTDIVVPDLPVAEVLARL